MRRFCFDLLGVPADHRTRSGAVLDWNTPSADSPVFPKQISGSVQSCPGVRHVFWCILRIGNCRHLQQYFHIMSMITQFVIMAMLELLVYALYGRNRRVLAMLVAVAGPGAAISIWAMIQSVRNHPDIDEVTSKVQACDLTLSAEEGHCELVPRIASPHLGDPHRTILQRGISTSHGARRSFLFRVRGCLDCCGHDEYLNSRAVRTACSFVAICQAYW
ncbi:hypothetical protein BD413DRAFT_44385 [Trametes elegans]|nr:hypothetical protein BD413DRAFT_44385 [Trametes elegans]